MSEKITKYEDLPKKFKQDNGDLKPCYKVLYRRFYRAKDVRVGDIVFDLSNSRAKVAGHFNDGLIIKHETAVIP